MNRRDFFKDAGSLAMTLALAGGAVEVTARAEELQAADDAPAGPPVPCAVIGINQQGREIINALAKMNNAPLVICDTYQAPGFLKKSTEIAPKADVVDDYKKVLDRKDVTAVFVATPSNAHKEIVLAALQAGKHVYCEAPLAGSIDDAKAIAKAGLAAATFLQPGLQERYNKQNHHVLEFVRSDTLGNLAGGRGQWHQKTSWKQPAPNDERQAQLDWKIKKATSGGLAGEIGIHQIDVASWFFKQLPISVTGFGTNAFWSDIEVPDTIQTIVEYPNNVRFIFDATLANSYQGAYEVFMGSECAMLLRGQRAWMFKETDSKLLGWEVYARKDTLECGPEAMGTGIALVADATKLIAQGKQPGQVGTDVTKTALYQAIDSFFNSIRTNKKPETGPVEGYVANVVALKTNEAVLSGGKITFDKAWFELS